MLHVIYIICIISITSAQYVPELKTLTACENQVLNLQCNFGEVVSIKSATYGRTDGYTCYEYCCIHNTNCTVNSSLDIVREKCENQQKCTIYASNSMFGDPCVGTRKYLTLQYQCEPAPPCKIDEFQCQNGTCIPDSFVSNGLKDCSKGEDEIYQDYLSQYACETDTLTIRCNTNEYISIVNANYGRLSSTICTNNAVDNLNCRAADSLKIIENRCNGKGFCEIVSRNDIFGDPCPKTSKYLEVHYKCVKSPSCSDYEYQCNYGKCIDATLRCDGKWDCAGGEDELQCSFLTEIACEEDILKIECKPNDVIQVIGANYGRQKPYICHKNPHINCVAQDSKEVVENKCNGQRTCSIEVRKTQFGDPCVGIQKYLSVNYQCVQYKK